MDLKEYIDQRIPVNELYKIGFLETKTDYDKIAKKICSFFSLNNIFEYDLIMNKPEKPFIKAIPETFSLN